MSQTQISPRIRIEKIELHNIKGVKNGIVEFNCLKTPSEKDTCSDILGLYGQNGSGKTTLLEAMHIAKLAMMGRSIPFDKYGNIIAQGAGSARVAISFQVSNPDGSLYHLEYAFSLGTWTITSGNKTNSSNGDGMIKIAGSTITSSALPTFALAAAFGIVTAPLMPAVAAAGAAGIVASQIMKFSGSEKDVLAEKETKHLAVFDEVLSLSGMFNGSMIRQGPIFDTSSSETVFSPKAKQKAFFPNKTTAVLKDLEKCRKSTLVTSRSFIFCDELSQLLLGQGEITDYGQIILDIKAFAIQKIRIFESKTVSPIGNDVIPLYTADRVVGVERRDSTAILDDEGLNTLKTAINGLNTVLQTIIPGMSLEAVRQIDVDINNRNVRAHSKGEKVTVYSVRDNVRIPLAEESSGIIRLISSMGLFVNAFVNQDVTVAIDEIDAGVYEYLLGELLLIFEEYGSGQLIFTCHNLRPMEVLNKKYIYFTTTNPESRYLKPKSVRNENNLRDVYLKEIVRGGQEEELYSAIKHGKIASALQKAGEIIGQD